MRAGRCISFKTTPNPVRLSSRRSLKGLKSGIREDLHLIRLDRLDDTNYKSPSGDLGVVEEEYELILKI